MKFLLDVHIGKAIADALSERHDVLRAALAYPTWSDARLLQLAVDQEMVLVTQDSDFSDLIYAHFAPPPPAMVYIRIEPDEQASMKPRIIQVLGSRKIMGQMTVIKPSSVRYRPLPRIESDHG